MGSPTLPSGHRPPHPQALEGKQFSDSGLPRNPFISQFKQPDPESTVCDDPSCKRSFNYFIRRHHCRCCGNIFCDWHSSYAMPLDQDANFNPRAPVPSRTCAHCFKQHEQTWQQQHPRAHSTSSASSSNRSSEAKSGATSPLTPVGMPVGARNIIPGAQTPNVAKTPEVAASVPSDWNWSTF